MTFIPDGKALVPRQVRDRVGGTVDCRYRVRLRALDSGDAAPTVNAGRAQSVKPGRMAPRKQTQLAEQATVGVAPGRSLNPRVQQPFDRGVREASLLRRSGQCGTKRKGAGRNQLY